MKGLWKYIPPFAPDQSGACSVLCELGGLIIIIDAGGCAGNICGFDEPRWFASKSAIFSAGLRDMDAILGRDERLVEKTVKACEQIPARFVALVGTPVPAVIGTDYRALKRMISKRTGLPVFTAETTGTSFYDKGAEAMYLELVKSYLPKNSSWKSPDSQEGENTLYLGGIPLDTDGQNHPHWFGMGEDLEVFTNLEEKYSKVQVIAPSGLAAAREMTKRTGIPYAIDYPLDTLAGYQKFLKSIEEGKWNQYKKILIVHQQVLAHSIRMELEKGSKAHIDVASWFMMDDEIKRSGDLSLKEEDQWVELVRDGNYDLIIADQIMERPVAGLAKKYMNLPHYALSGHMLTLGDLLW